jgi:hypothetical protein
MTAPAPIIQLPGIGEELQAGLAPFIAALQQRQQLGLQRQQLEIERQKAEAQIAQAGAATAESRARTKEILEELEQKKVQLEANDFATEQFIMTMTSTGGLSPENLVTARERITKEADKDISSEAMLAFDALVKQEEEQRLLTAQREAAQTEADVAERTADARVAAAELAPQATQAQIDFAEAQTERAEVDTRIMQLAETRDPTRVQLAAALWELGGVTWKEVRETAGLAAGGIDDDAVFTPTAAGGAGSEYNRKAGTFARLMQTSGALIDALVEQTGGITAMASFMRQTRSATLDIVINNLIDSKQQELVNAHRTFGDAFRFFVSGQQSSDREALRILNTVAEQSGDSRETRDQKRLMRRAMTRAALDAAAGTINPVEAMDTVIEEAETIGIDERKMKVFREMRQDALNYQQRLLTGRGPLFISDQPTTIDSLSASRALTDSIIGARFAVPLRN